MKDKYRNRWIWTIVILLAFIGIAEAIRRTLIIENIIPGFSPPKYPGFDAGFTKHRKLTIFHMIPGIAFMIFGPLLFVKRIQIQPRLFGWIRTIFSFPPILLE